MDLQSLQKDRVFIEKVDGSRLGPYKTSVSDGGAIIFDGELDVNDGETLIRVLPSQKEEAYLILSADYSHGIDSAIPPHFNLKLQKKSAIRQPAAKNTTINIHHSTGIQVGDHNAISIQNALNDLGGKIEASEASPQEKAEARGLLSSFLAHPLVGSVLGGVAGAIVGGAGS